MAKTCPAHGCAVEIKRSNLMCREHWMGIPRNLRLTVNSSWRSFKASAGEPVAVHIAILREYRSAADAAVDWWKPS